jgi:hypothetical protein
VQTTPLPPTLSHPLSPTSPPPEQIVEHPCGTQEGSGGAFSFGSKEVRLDLVWTDTHVAQAMKVWCKSLIIASIELGHVAARAREE